MQNDSTTRRIPLTQGKVTLVDAADFEMLSHWSWSVSTAGYARRGQRRSGPSDHVYMHRQLMLPEQDQEVDHINGQPLDNRRANLRLCSHQENQRSSRRFQGTSSHKGVHWQTRAGMWLADLTTDGHKYHLGRYLSENAAARAYDAKARELYGEFAVLNFPDADS